VGKPLARFDEGGSVKLESEGSRALLYGVKNDLFYGKIIIKATGVREIIFN